MSQDTMTYTEEKIAKNKEAFHVGAIVCAHDSEYRSSSNGGYLKAIVSRHTKNRIMVHLVLENGEKYGEEMSYNAETLYKVGSSSSRYTQNLMKCDDGLLLKSEIKKLNKELGEARHKLGQGVHKNDYEAMLELTQKITNVIAELKEKNAIYGEAINKTREW